MRPRLTHVTHRTLSVPLQRGSRRHADGAYCRRKSRRRPANQDLIPRSHDDSKATIARGLFAPAANPSVTRCGHRVAVRDTAAPLFVTRHHLERCSGQANARARTRFHASAAA